MTWSRLLALPRELRNIILEHYVATNDGYAYNFTTNKLRHANGDPINLSLALTCTQLGYEMRGLALRTNTIHFSTFFSEETVRPAGLFQAAITYKIGMHYALVKYLGSRLLTPAMTLCVAEQYPELMPIVERWCLPDPGRNAHLDNTRPSYGIAPSLLADCVSYILWLLSAHPDYLRVASTVPGYTKFYIGNEAMEVAHAQCEPWDIPSSDELEKIMDVLGIQGREGRNYWNFIKYSYSAASLTIRFLKSIPIQPREQLRNVVLHEDFEAIAVPACHARGLIPFCKENPRLRVEWVVKLWQTVLTVDSDRERHYYGRELFRDLHGPPDVEVQNDKLTSRSITKAVGAWIMEVQLLPSLGMPQNSYTLTLDGDAIREKSTMVFDIVQRDVAWQDALDMSYERGFLPTPSWADRRTQTGYIYEGLPAAIKAISRGNGIVRCNFDPGASQDAETLAAAHVRWSLEEWNSTWSSHNPQEFETDPPLPPWHELKWQRVLLPN